jgi:adenylate cyclase
LAWIEETGERFYEAELFRLRGELLHACAIAAVDACTCVDRAVEIAGRQRARSLELRARITLTRYARRRAEGDAARRALRETHGQFTEGLDTPDLQEARDLIGAGQ